MKALILYTKMDFQSQKQSWHCHYIVSFTVLVACETESEHGGGQGEAKKSWLLLWKGELQRAVS